jgi:hypothetical protein
MRPTLSVPPVFATVDRGNIPPRGVGEVPRFLEGIAGRLGGAWLAIIAFSPGGAVLGSWGTDAPSISGAPSRFAIASVRFAPDGPSWKS